MTVEELQQQLADVYTERNTLAQFLGTLMAEEGRHVLRVEQADPQWPVLLISTPAGQISYHIPANEWIIRTQSEAVHAWDGHTTEEKYQRIRAYIQGITPEAI